MNRPTPEQTEPQIPVASAVSANDETDFDAAKAAASGDTPTFAPPAADGELGRLGKYRIRKQLGQGGMGAVYLAFDEKLQRQVALKVMLPKAAGSASAKERFLREARAAAQISNDHVVAIYEADEIDGTPYIALQYLQGSPLDQYLRDKGNLPLAHITRLIRETAEGLAAAHRLGLIHRDIKPANLWLEAPKGRVKILDFGLARQEREDVQLTQSGAVVGTPSYMSPEQARGKALDGRSDLFSLGAVLYRLLTGEVPFKGDTTMAVLMALGTEEPPRVEQRNPAVPPALADLTHRLLAKNPDQRPKDAATLVKLLQDIEAGKNTTNAPPVPIVEVLPLAVSVQTENVWEHIEDDPSSRQVTEARAPSSANVQTQLLPPKKKKVPLALVGTLLLGVLSLVGAGVIIIKIKNKDGTETEIKVPDTSIVEVNGKNVTPPPQKLDPLPPSTYTWKPIPVGESPFDKLDPAAIPKEERFDWQPKELVGVIGKHERRHWWPVQAIAFSPDGKFAASMAGQDLVVWDMATQRAVGTFSFGWPLFSADGKTLYVYQADASYSIDLTRLPLAKTATTNPIPEPGVWQHLRRIEDGRTLLATEHGGKWQAIVVDTSGEKAQVGGRIECSMSFFRANFYPSRAGRAVYQSKDRKLRQVEIRAAKFINDRELPIGNAMVEPKAISDDGKVLALWVKDHLEIWDIADEKPKKRTEIKADGIAGIYSRYSLCADGRWLTGTYTHTALWRIDGAEPKLAGWLDQTGVGDVGSVAFSQDGNLAIVGNHEGFVRFWDLSGAEPKELSPFDPATAFASPHSDKGPSLDAACGSLMLPRYDVQPNRRQRYELWNLSVSKPSALSLLDSEIFGRIRALGQDRWLQVGERSRLYCSTPDGIKPQGEPFGDRHTLGNVSPDGKTLVVYTPFEKPTELQGWDVSTDQPKLRWKLNPNDHTLLCFPWGCKVWFSADNRWMATQGAAAKEGEPWKLVIWRNTGAKPELHAVLPCTCHPGGFGAAFSHDGRYFAHTPEQPHTISIMDLTGPKPREIQRIDDYGRLAALQSLAFHPDGKHLAYGSNVGAGVLDVTTGKTVYEWKAPGPVDWVDWATDGRHLVTHNGNKTVYVLRLNQFGGVAKAAAANPDHALAEWVLSVPGNSVQLVGRDAYITQRDALPAEPYKVYRIQLLTPERLTDTDFARVRGVNELHDIVIQGNQSALTDRAFQLLAENAGPALGALVIYNECPQVTDAAIVHLNRMTSLTNLALNSQRITNAGLAKLELPNLHTLALWSKATPLGLKNGKARLPKLQNVDFRGAAITPEELEFLSQWSLTGIGLCEGTDVRDQNLKLLKCSDTLLQLDLKGNEITDNGIELIRDYRKLKNIFVEGPKLTDAACDHLKQLPELAIVFFRSSRITDKGVTTLCALPNLKQLDLARNEAITDAALERIAQCSALEFVYLVDCKQITAAGVQKLAKALPKCRIESDHGTFGPTAAADPDRKAAEWVLSVGGAVRVEGNERQIKALADVPKDAFRLGEVWLSGTKVSDDALAMFKDCTRLTYLNLNGTAVTNAGLAHFQHCTNLVVLSLGGTKVTDDGLALFKDCKNLRHLHLDETMITDVGVTHFHNCKNLAHITLLKTKVTAVKIEELKKALPKCKIEWDGGVIDPAK